MMQGYEILYPERRLGSVWQDETMAHFMGTLELCAERFKEGKTQKL
jgi:hypothetical protein